MSDHWYETPKKMGRAAIQPAQIVGAFAAVSLALSVWFPILLASGRAGAKSQSLHDGSGRLVAYVLISAGLVLVGVFASPQGARGMALAIGAAVPIAGLFGFAASVVLRLYDTHSLIGDVSFGPSLYFICLSVVSCLVLAGITFGQRDRKARRSDGQHVAVGIISGCAMSVGVMLSPGKAGTSFIKMNFGWSSWHMQVAWLLFVCLVGLPGVVGFALRTVWGADLALGALLAPAWLVLTALAPASAPAVFGFTFRAVHPVIVIALGGQILAQILFRVVTRPGGRWASSS